MLSAAYEVLSDPTVSVTYIGINSIMTTCRKKRQIYDRHGEVRIEDDFYYQGLTRFIRRD